jgi:hypothetical protein
MSQNADILRYLDMFRKPITAAKALQLCGCFRLAARVYELRNQGYAIKSRLITVGSKRVAEYYLG